MKPILNKKTGYVDYNAIFEPGVKIYMLLGQRSDGKTYGAVQDSIQTYAKTGVPSAYIRRFAESTTRALLQDLTRPHCANIKKSTGGKYNASEYHSKRFYFTTLGDEPTRDTNPFLSVFALNTWENAKGADSGNFHNVIFDEYVSNNKYLPNEYSIFENVLSSILRTRAESRLIMLGNPINQICPYFDEFNIEPHKLKPGDIVYRKSSNGAILKFVYIPPMSEKHTTLHSIFDFNKSGSISTGYWEYGDFPHIPAGMIKQSDFIYAFAFMFRNQFAVCEFYQKNDIVYCFWRPGNPDKILNDRDIVLYSDMHLFQPNVFTAFTRNQITDLYDKCRTSNRQYFADNKTGNLVKNWYQEFVRNGGRF